ncbi:MAG: DUF3795 domain-containing protein [Raoultibacter sp.]
MDKAYQTAPCGLDCFNCSWFEENLTDDIRLQEAGRLGITVDQVGCKGCRDEQGKCYWAKGDCATWACVEKKGLTYCFECDEFPCGLLAPTEKGADYPHNMKVYNLCRMKLNGLESWIEESAEIRKRYYEGDFIVGQGPVV